MAKVGNGTRPAPASSVRVVQMLESMSMSSSRTSHVELVLGMLGRIGRCGRVLCMFWLFRTTFLTNLGMPIVLLGGNWVVAR